MEAPRPDRVALSRELSEFLIELSVALHRHSMYPTGHPSLEPAVDSVLRRADRLLQARTSIAFGVARRQLVIEGVMTDPNQLALRRLAEGLHGHHLGAVSITRGVEPYEISEALRALAAEPQQDGPLGLTQDGLLTSWPHVKLHPLSFDGLALAGEVPSDGADSRQTARSAELWVGLARAAMSSDPHSAEEVSTEPSAVAKAIEDHPRAEAYDQVIVGYLLQIARELKTASGEKAEELRRRTSTLIASLRPDTLRRLVEMGGNTGQRRQFVLDAANGMAVDAVIEIMRAAADASGQTISHGLVRMLSKLAMHAEHGSDFARPRADVELREQVRRLLQDWRLEDPNPEVYGRVLQHMSTSSPGDQRSAAEEVAERPDPLRLVQIGLEAGAFGPLAEKAVDEIVRTGQVSAVFETLAARPEGGGEVSDQFLRRLTRPEAHEAIVTHEPIDVASLDAVLPRLSRAGYARLLSALATSENRATRRRLLDRLARTDEDIAPLVVEHLEDERWFVQRNMLVLLERTGRVPAGFSPTYWTTHPDPRVRCEAIRLQLSLPRERELGVSAALSDIDPRVVHLGLTAVQHDCPPDLVGRVIELALAPELGDEISLLAVTALARAPDVAVLEMLLELADGGRSLLGRARLPPKSPILLAVLRALSDSWADDPRAATLLAVAAESSDPELRHAVASATT
jgi:hypothetical protein